MCETYCEKFKQRCQPLIFALRLSHLKSVFIGLVSEYETPKIVTIHSYSIALTCRFVQLLILIYAFVYLMWIKRGYQDHDLSLISSVTLKVKGVGGLGKNQTPTVDNADFVIPPQENNALFIMTNFIRTDQQRKLCAESKDIKQASCKNDSDCLAFGAYPAKSNGHWTGKCRRPENRCEMESWCPVENDHDVPDPVMDALNFTVLIKNFVEFTRFGISRKNFETSDAPGRCLYHPEHNKICPIIRIGDLLEIAEPNDEERFLMLRFGAVVRIKIDWICNLDLGVDQCKPSYSFGRLDSRSKEENFSFGFNFRYASHWKSRGKSHRLLTKAFGLRLIITVNGEAGRFDLPTLTLNIGSMIGILGLATFVCDIVALYCCKQGSLYRQEKFQTVNLALSSSLDTIGRQQASISNSSQIRNTTCLFINNHLADRDEF